ncbi:MAG: 5'-methylthioadenosine/S-adenosylhomocysteine nucleosidase [Acutalibacteraceae bacterium]|nr:5'-methylthioadenosine/S-adenosylhomocysteine nucleosidase [Acutalibacteraceae bacterium]
MENIKKIGIIVADTDEFAPLEENIKKGEYTEKTFLKRKILEFKIGAIEICTMLCGIGKVNAAAGATHLIDTGCEIILNYGLSGGISGIRRGELCLCNRFLEHDFNLTTIGYKPCEKPGQNSYIYNSDKRLNDVVKSLLPDIKEGLAVTGDCFVCDENLRSFLKEEFGAMCCDMETAAIAYVCEYAGVPFTAVRRVSDDAGESALESYREMNTSGETVLSDFILECAKAAANKL